MEPRVSVSLGLVCAGLAAAVIAIDAPFNAIAAALILLLVTGAWLTIAIRRGPRKNK